MAQYDDATLEFMAKIAADDKAEKEHKGISGKTAIRQSVGLMKDLSKPSQSKQEAALAKRVFTLATKTTMSALTKMAGISPIGIYEMLNRQYGDDWHDWEPETIWQTLYQEQAVTPTEEVKNLIQAIQLVCRTNFAFEDFHVFEKVGHAFNLNHVMFDSMQPLEPDEIALEIIILKAIRPQVDFEDEVNGYIAACAKLAGMVYLPEKLFGSEPQIFLDDLGNDLELKAEVIAHLDNIKSATVAEDSPLDIQLSRIQEIREYITDLPEV